MPDVLEGTTSSEASISVLRYDMTDSEALFGGSAIVGDESLHGGGLAWLKVPLKGRYPSPHFLPLGDFFAADSVYG